MKRRNVLKSGAVKAVAVGITLTLIGASANAQTKTLGPVDVNVVNMPTVQLAGTATVKVASSSSDPIVVRDPEVSHQPWHIFLGPNDQYTVPAGKRLVIEYANGIAQLGVNGQADWTLGVQETEGGQGYHFAGQSLAGCTNCYVMSQQVRIYAPTGSVISVGVVPVGSVAEALGLLDRRIGSFMAGDREQAATEADR